MAKRMVGLLALTTMLLGGLALVAAPAQAQGACDITAEYQGTATFGTNLTVVNAGGEIVFEGTGWPPNVTLQLSVNGQQVGSVTTSASGAWSFTYTVPANASGTQTAEVSCGSFVLSTQFSVSTSVAPVTGTTTTPLPVTGSDSLSWAQMGIALIALGAVLVYLTRRRSQRQEALIQS
jgi:LPXTG-motif cell wall-anchored protein